MVVLPRFSTVRMNLIPTVAISKAQGHRLDELVSIAVLQPCQDGSSGLNMKGRYDNITTFIHIDSAASMT